METLNINHVGDQEGGVKWDKAQRGMAVRNSAWLGTV